MKPVIFLWLTLISIVAFGGENYRKHSVLSAGYWYKIGVKQSGIYKITYDDLVAMGFNLSQLNDSNIRLFGNGGSMLPEVNGARMHDDLNETPVLVVDGNDGRMDPGDYILFFGDSPDSWTFNNATTHTFVHTKNLFSDYSYYYINADQEKGKRVQSLASLDTIPNMVSAFTDDFAFHEADERNLISSGRTWYGEVFDHTKDTYSFAFNFSGLDPLSDVRIITNVAARSVADSKFILTINGQIEDSVVVDHIIQSSVADFARGAQRTTLYTPEESRLDIDLSYRMPSQNAMGWLNFIEVNCRRALRWMGPQMSFRDAASVGKKNITQFILANVPNDVFIWDITDRGDIRNIQGLNSNDTTRFNIRTDSLKEFIAFDNSYLFPVEVIERVQNQDLHAIDSVTMVIVTHPMFKEQAKRLADFHVQHDGISVEVADVFQVYNEFSSGQPDLTAIRDFAKMIYDKETMGSNGLRYMLLFGDGSYDPKNRIPGNNNMIPTFQSPESLNSFQSYVTDDYFGILEDGEGGNSDGTIDIGIGRFPVTTADQAKSLVDKVIHYEMVADTAMSGWKNIMTFVADDENNNLHMHQTEELDEITEQKYPVYNVNKIYLDSYPLVHTPSGDRFPEVNKAINNAINKGTLMLTYTGHGGEDGLALEKVVTTSDIAGWRNPDRLPVVITATCEFSRFDNPERYSAGEMVINRSEGGAVALFTTTRQAIASSNIKLDTSIFRNLIPSDGSPVPSFGDMIRMAKNNTHNLAILRNFVLLGDPAQHVAFPTYRIAATEINGHSMNGILDTLRGLSTVTVQGEIQDPAGNKLHNFNGVVSTKVFDKIRTYRTIGNKPEQEGSYPENFNLRDCVISEQKSTVTNGEFQVSFVVPKDIALQVGAGRISFYAADPQQDGNGFCDSVLIGGSVPGIVPENPGPEIKLFMDHTDFVSGGVTSPNPELLAFLRDDNGINATGLGIGHEILAVLDEDQSHSIVLNEYYTPEMDRFDRGTVAFPFSGLSTGLHVLNVKAWDYYNNSYSSEIRFFVSDPPVITVQEVGNFPNPFHDQTTFRFTPVANTGDLDVVIRIFAAQGRSLKTIESHISEYGNTPVTIGWDGRDDNGSKVSAGFYIYQVVIRDENNAFMQTAGKMVIF